MKRFSGGASLKGKATKTWARCPSPPISHRRLSTTLATISVWRVRRLVRHRRYRRAVCFRPADSCRCRQRCPWHRPERCPIPAKIPAGWARPRATFSFFVLCTQEKSGNFAIEVFFSLWLNKINEL
jgi:hypothetical protein